MHNTVTLFISWVFLTSCCKTPDRKVPESNQIFNSYINYWFIAILIVLSQQALIKLCPYTMTAYNNAVNKAIYF